MVKFLLLLIIYNPQTGEMKEWENPVLGFSTAGWCYADLEQKMKQAKPPEGFKVLGRCVSIDDLKH